jgi:hypothetical protein
MSDHSARIALTGSSLTARRAGRKLPASAVAIARPAAAANTAGSAGLTPASSAFIARPAPYAISAPGDDAGGREADAVADDHARTSRGCGPERDADADLALALRHGERQQPWMPSAARARAAAANAPRARAWSRRGAVSSRTISDIVLTSETGI